MNKQSFLAQIALFLLIVLTLLCCRKQTSRQIDNASLNSAEALIQEAQEYMKQQHFTDSIHQDGDTLPMDRTSLHKTPLWTLAIVDSFSFGPGVVVPLSIAEPLSILVGPGFTPMAISNLTWLLLYQDKNQLWHAVVITRIPLVAQGGQPFQGHIRVEDWQGNFLKGYLYSGKQTTLLDQSITFRGISFPKPQVPDFEAAATPTCTTTDWYACSSIGGVFTGCEYAYSVEECSSGIGEDGPGDGGGPSAADYATVGSGGAGSSGSGTAVDQIIPDTSVTNNPIVNCVYTHLMNPKMLTNLKTILSAFNDNNIYNLTITVGNTNGLDGKTQYLGNNQFRITLEASEADDPDYSRIYLASTLIHEAFHAKLRQKALQVFGEAPISQWPTPIDDMTLNQLATYFETESKSTNIWQSVEHDWMVDNISEMAACLQDFVQTYYPTLYAQLGSSSDPYVALMYMGLQSSTLYQEQVVATGQETAVEAWLPKLNEGGKCQD